MNDLTAIDYFETAKQIVREDAAKRLATAKKRKTWDFETVVYVLDHDGADWGIAVGISYDATYEPGRLSGPWEDCYPASGDMDIHDIEIIDDLPLGITEQMVMDACETARDRLEDESWEDYMDQRAEP